MTKAIEQAAKASERDSKQAAKASQTPSNIPMARAMEALPRVEGGLDLHHKRTSERRCHQALAAKAPWGAVLGEGPSRRKRQEGEPCGAKAHGKGRSRLGR